jgi:hypothetical protein
MEFSSGCFFATRKNIMSRTFMRIIKDRAVYSISDGVLLAGSLPPNKHKLVVAWIEIHQEDLLADWNLAVNGKQPFPIKGLDQ